MRNYFATLALAILVLGFPSGVVANQGTVETVDGACEIRDIDLFERSVRGAKWCGRCKDGKVSGMGTLLYKDHLGKQSADWGLFLDGAASGYHLRRNSQPVLYAIVSYSPKGPSATHTNVPFTAAEVRKSVPAPKGPSVSIDEIFTLQRKHRSALALFRNAPTAADTIWSNQAATNSAASVDDPKVLGGGAAGIK